MKKMHDVRFNALLNVIKQLCAVIFPLITMPYVSRVLGTDNYGKINFSMSIVNYFIIFAGLGTQNYGTREGARLRQNRPAFDRFASEVFTLNSLSVLLAYSVLFCILMCFDTLSGYTTLILVQSLSIAFTWLGMDWVNSAHEDYAFITIRYIVAQFLAILSMFLFVKDSQDYVIYATITTLAGYGVNLLNIFYIRKYTHVKFCFSKSMFQHLLPLIILLSNSIAVTIYVNSGITLLGLFRTDAEVGIYSIATKIYTIVKQLLNAMLIVFIPRLSAMLGQNQENDYVQMLHGLLNVLIGLLLPAVVGLMCLSNEIVLLISGPEFLEAGKSLLILGISLGFAVFACFFSNCILLPIKKDKLFLFATLAGCGTNIVLNFIAIPLWGHIGAALTTVAAEAVVMAVCLICSRKFVALSVSRKGIFSTAIGCAVIVGITSVVKLFSLPLILHLMVSIGLSVIAYVAVLAIFKNPLIKDAVLMLKKR